ncbi:MAG TPA: ABC transporter substrate-binding protein, partial [Chloroflexota bacterium]|nr:ABC transporter substrate-binding protein [Chloroflexota bacterium]
MRHNQDQTPGEDVDRRATLSRRSLLRATLGVASLSVLAACSPSSPAPSATSAAPASAQGAAPPAATTAAGAASKPAAGATEHVKIGATPAIASAGVYIGLDRNYFRDQGIDVEVVNFAGAADMVQSLGASQLDGGNLDAGAGVWNVLGRGIQMRFVADGNHAEKGHTGNAWMIRKDLIDSGAFKDLPDLKGKTVSPIGKGSLIDSQFYRSLEKAGLKDTDVNVQYIAFADCLPAFANKALDAAILTEPFVANAVGQGLAVRWRGLDEVLGNYQGTMLMYSQNFTEQRRDVGNRFMVGYIKGIRDYIDAFNGGQDYDAVVSLLTKYTNLKDPALYKQI